MHQVNTHIWELLRINKLPQSASSGRYRNCSFYHCHLQVTARCNSLPRLSISCSYKAYIMVVVTGDVVDVCQWQEFKNNKIVSGKKWNL